MVGTLVVLANSFQHSLSLLTMFITELATLMHLMHSMEDGSSYPCPTKMCGISAHKYIIAIESHYNNPGLPKTSTSH